jgi:hypothetical protein
LCGGFAFAQKPNEHAVNPTYSNGLAMYYKRCNDHYTGAGKPARTEEQDMDNEYTTAAKNMIDQAVEDRDNGVITLAEFYRTCAAAVTILQAKSAPSMTEAGA